MRAAARLLPLATLLAALGAAACRDAPAAGPGAPLLDADHPPDVLVEARELAPPPASGGNRFVAGWWPQRRDDGLRLIPDAGGAVLEGVHLGGGPRRLRLALEAVPAAADAALPATVEVSIAGGPEQTVPLGGDAVEIPLSADLPRGRFGVSLRFPADRDVTVRGAGFDRALPAGAVAVEGGDVRQAGVSLVELVRPLAAPAAVVGRFVPPAEPAPGQRFELWLVAADGSERRLWQWRAGWRERLRGDHTLRIPVAPSEGWLRLRLFAATAGPAATWEELALVGDGAAPARAGDAAGGSGSLPPPELVLLYVLDALRADAVGHLGGDPAATPTLDRLAREGGTFRRHFATAPNTLPSTKTLLTGRTWRQRGGWGLGADGPPTLAEIFRRAGWRTGLFSGNVHVSPAFGLDRGFETAPQDTLYESYADRERPPYNDSAERVNRAALAWLATLRPGERAFLYLHPVNPHNPYAPPSELQARFAAGGGVDGSTETLLAVRNQRLALADGDRARIAALYRGGLAYADAQLGALLAAIAERVPAERTAVVVTADHGEELFDHGGVLHGYTLYDEQLHIPLVVHWPAAVEAGSVVEEPTDTADVHAALAGLAGGVGAAARPAGSPPVLWRLLGAAGGAVSRPSPRFAAASSIKGGIFMARTPRFKVIWAPRTGSHWGMGEGLGRNRDAEAVFDLAADPGERRNLAALVDHPEVRWLRARLLAWAQRPEPEEGAAPAPADEATRKQLEALGYAN